MDTLPIVGKEYTYLGRPVEVLRVIPLTGGTPQEAIVEFRTRTHEYGETKAMYLTER